MKITNCIVRKSVKELDNNFKKKRVTIVTREYENANKTRHIIVNKSFKDYDKAMDEVIKCFGEMGAYI